MEGLPRAIVQPLELLAGAPIYQDDGNVDLDAVQKVLLSELGSWEEVPLLTHANVDSHCNGSLVRYTGMVQDMLNPEYYVGSIQQTDGSWTSTHFQDYVGGGIAEGAQTKIAERRPLFLTQAPGCSAWAVPKSIVLPTMLSTDSSRSVKRGRDQTTGPGEADENLPAAANTEAGTLPSSSVKTPLLNDLVSVVGILSIMPELGTVTGAEADGEGAVLQLDDEFRVAHPPTSRCPRLHVVAVLPATRTAVPTATTAVREARSKTLGLLSMALGGDNLAAEYLLLQLVGRVHSRSVDAGVVGVGSLNLHGAPAAEGWALSPLAQALSLVLAALSPRATAYGLSIPELTAAPWWPRRDQGSQRLVPGRLQLARGTQALDTLLRTQKIAYDFEYFSLDQEAEAPVTILSCGKSMLKDATAASLRLAPSGPLAEPESLARALESSTLEPLRQYLEHARNLEFAIPAEVAVAVENDLATARQKDSSLTPVDLHHHMNVARLLTASHGQSALTVEFWEQAKNLEHRRAQRSS